jgi:hypothetical protein
VSVHRIRFFLFVERLGVHIPRCSAGRVCWLRSSTPALQVGRASDVVAHAGGITAIVLPKRRRGGDSGGPGQVPFPGG